MQQNYAHAEAASRKAIELEPDFAEAYLNLGSALIGQQKYSQVEAAYRKAIEVKPDFAEAHYNLGTYLVTQGKHAEAEAAYREAIARKPNFPAAHFGLGMALNEQQKLDEAETAFRRAIDLAPDSGLACYFLGLVLMQQARFNEAAASFKKANGLLPAKHPRRQQARQMQQQCQRYAILDTRLPAILLRTEKPANAAEQIEFARLCLYQKANTAAARFFRDGFAAEPKLAGAVPTATRYDAACAAALAGCGRGKDADNLDDKERADWRRQALDWLRQDLIWWSKALANGNAQTNTDVRVNMRHSQTDGDLAGVRAKDSLARLPDEERQQWERFWSDVDALLLRVSEPK